MMSMGPVVELSGEIHDVEDLTSNSSVMRSSECSVSVHDEDEDKTPGATGGVTAGSPPRKKKMKRFYAMALVLITLFVGCGYTITKLGLVNGSGSDKQQSATTDTLSVSKNNNAPIADKELGSETAAQGIQELASSGLPALAIGAINDGIAAIAAVGPAVAAIAGTTGAKADSAAVSLLQSGSKFQIQDVASTLCFDLGDDAESPTVVLQKCDSERGSQGFVYDPFNSVVLSKARPGLCIDSGTSGRSFSAPSAGSNAPKALHLRPCGFARAWHQTFQFDSESAAFKTPKPELCMDTMASASLRSAGQAPLTANLSPCDPSQRRQRLELLPITDRAVWDVNNPVLRAKGQQFLLRSTGKANLCLGGSDPSDKLQAVTCDPSDDSQLFTYNTQNHWIQSASNHALCLDDNGSWLSGASNKPDIRMAPCEETSINQHFVYDEFAKVVRSPTKPQLCLDDGGRFDTSGKPSAFRFVRCDLSSGDQQFQIVTRTSLLSISPLALLTSYTPFVIESVYKGLCVGTSSSGASVDEELRLGQCDSTAPGADQTFQYYAELQLIKSSKRPGYCWSTSPSSGTDDGFELTMAQCDPESSSQLFVYDADAEQFQSATDKKLCVDDGGGWFAGETRLALLPCEESSVHQKFHLRAA
ncbi:hypothetical protein Gpo141_00006165 [Globisporangium polare]